MTQFIPIDVNIQGLTLSKEFAAGTSVEDAQRTAEEFYEKNPGLLAEPAFEQGKTFDFENNQVRDLTGAEKFKIGAGRTFTEVGEFFTDMGLSFSDEELDSIVTKRRAAEAQMFEDLDKHSIGWEDVGQLAPFFAGTGAKLSVAAVRTLLGKTGAAEVSAVGANVGMTGSGLVNFIKGAANKTITGRLLKAAAGTKVGKMVLQRLGKFDTKKTIDSALDILKKEGTKVEKIAEASNKAFRPGANQGVRDAQVKIAKSLREQVPKPATQITKPTAAQNSAGAGARTASNTRRTAQAGRAKKALQASQRAASESSKANKQRVNREIAKLVRQQSTR